MNDGFRWSFGNTAGVVLTESDAIALLRVMAERIHTGHGERCAVCNLLDCDLLTFLWLWDRQPQHEDGHPRRCMVCNGHRKFSVGQNEYECKECGTGRADRAKGDGTK